MCKRKCVSKKMRQKELETGMLKEGTKGKQRKQG